jgi:phytoene dehydrogenase-like protein
MDLPAKAVAIVGGGLGGLTAAVQLGRLGIPAVLFDGAADPGGRAGAHSGQGFHLNYRLHRLFDCGAGVNLLRRLDVPVNAAPRGANGGLAVWRGRSYTLPVGCCSLLTTGLLGANAKRELARLLTSLKTVSVEELEHVSIGRWLGTLGSDPDVLQLVLAMVRHATYCNDPDRLSASAAIEQLRLSMRGAALQIHHGQASLVASLRRVATASGATLVSGSRVTGLQSANGRAAGVILADGTSIAAEAVIVATGPKSALQLLSDTAGYTVSTTAMRVAALDVALRRLPRERTLFALGIDEPWCFSADSVIAPPRSAVVHLAKCLPTGVDGTAADERQLERGLDLLQPGWRDVVVARRFVPSASVSHAMVTAEAGGFRGRPHGRVPGLDNVFLAGDWIGPIGQLADASIASGVEAARTAARLLADKADDLGAN